MLQLNPRERGIFILFVMVCSIYAGYVLVYRPAVFERQRIADELRLARKKLNEQMKVIQKEQRIPVALREVIAAKRQQAAPEEIMSGILSEIETAARGMTLRITEMKPQGVIKEEEFNKFPVSLTVDGNFQELMTFVHLLQAPEHDLTITQYQVEKGVADPRTLLAKIVVVRMLIRPQENSLQGASRTTSK